MKLIPLTKGQFAKVDDEDFEWLSKFKWFWSIGYAARAVTVPGKQITLWMHRTIMSTPDGLQCDHINHDKLDNQKSNLRNCTEAENKRNYPANHFNILGFRGVGFCKLTNNYIARITFNGKNHLSW